MAAGTYAGSPSRTSSRSAVTERSRAREGGSIFLALQAGRIEEAEAPPALLDALRISVESVWRTPLDYLLVLDSPAAVAQLAPAIDAFALLDTRGDIITAEGGDGVELTSRFFAPSIGVPEDSVTGSAPRKPRTLLG